MRPKDIKTLLHSFYPNGPSMFLLGPSGIGKTDIAYEVGEMFGFVSFNEWHKRIGERKLLVEATIKKLQEERKSDNEIRSAVDELNSKPVAEGMVYPMSMLLNDEVAFHGMPDLTADRQFMVWKAPQELPIVGNDLFPDKGFLFLDEFNTARRGLQTLGYQMTLERRIGNFILKPGWYPFMAGNRQEDKGEIHEVPGPLKNRLMRVYADVHFGDWFVWAQDHGVDPRIISYNLWKVSGEMEECSNIDDNHANSVGHLWKYDPLHLGWNWPTPRAWSSNVDYLLKHGILNMEQSVIQQAIGGCVGEAIASDFMAYLTLYTKIPTMEGLLTEKEKFPDTSHSPALGYATAIALTDYVVKHDGKMEGLSNVLLSPSMSPEFGMLIFQQLVTKGAVLKLTKVKNWEKLREVYKQVF
jgi:hypothetical protein